MSEFKNYLKLRDEIDLKVSELTALHQTNMVCQKGCDACCYAFKVFPVEFYTIKQATGLKGDYQIGDDIDGNERCQFLDNHQCTIYEHRPIICRTHGLPLLNMNEEGTDWELSACELNFTETDSGYLTEENVYVEDSYNSQLYQINKAYLAAHQHLKFEEFHLFPLKSLLQND